MMQQTDCGSPWWNQCSFPTAKNTGGGSDMAMLTYALGADWTSNHQTIVTLTGIQKQ